ncbi:MAG: transketolase, partial [Candidatus Nanopelagicales bacterium]|nr:transketolase [Candidatus Nanopelagicales bacterium]
MEWNDLDRRLVDTARVLAADAVHKAGSGHPGTAMAMAPAATLLFQRYLRHDPADPHWRGRDRFVLSAGHASILLYIQLYLSGYGLTLDDLKSLRTADSLTPGHPEYGLTPGVETTTGPLGQGLSTAVGMAMEQRFIRGMLDAGASPGQSPFDYNIWTIAGDGCLEEGITSEASSQAGHQQLGNLVVIYDDNHITIEGNTDVTFSEDVERRYRAYGWHTLHVDLSPNGSVDVFGLAKAFDAALAEIHRPTLIRVRSIIGWPAPTKQNTAAAHGSDLGSAEVAAVKEILGFDPKRSFQVDEELLAYARSVMLRGRRMHQEWSERLAVWRDDRPASAALFDRISAQRLPDNLAEAIAPFNTPGSISTRVASGKVINEIAGVMPEFWGGSADLAGSNETSIIDGGSFEPEGSMVPGASIKGRIIHFGIREHAMGAALNGIALDGLSRVYGGTFFVFSDYMRGAVRLSALMDIPVTYVWTHDSIGLGEDGPTHQPIEHLAA